MKSFGLKSFRIFNTWILIGFNLKHFGIGFGISRDSFNLDLGPFWFSIEF